MMQLYPSLTKDLQPMLGFYILYLILQSNYKEPPIVFLKKSGLYECDILYNRYMILNILIKWEYYYDATMYCEQVLEVSRKQCNEEIECDILETKAILIRCIQPKSFEEIVMNLNQHPSYQTQENIEKKQHLFYICGVYYYHKKEFRKAMQYFLKIVKDPVYDAVIYIFLNHIATIIKWKIPDILQFDHAIEYATESVQVMCQYFQMKYNTVDMQVLEDYIWNHRKVILKDIDPASLMENIIATELRWLSENTGNKKRLYQFNKTKYK